MGAEVKIGLYVECHNHGAEAGRRCGWSGSSAVVVVVVVVVSGESVRTTDSATAAALRCEPSD
jgi:hypothetical protein